MIGLVAVVSLLLSSKVQNVVDPIANAVVYRKLLMISRL